MTTEIDRRTLVSSSDVLAPIGAEQRYSEAAVPKLTRLTGMFFVVAVGLGMVGVIGLPLAAWSSRRVSQWLTAHTEWMLVGYADLLAIVAVASIVWWSRQRGTAVRAASVILLGSPAILMVLGGALYVAAPILRVNVIRTVVDVILMTVPAVMWWLFIASQRASLLNEFLSNLHRLGLFDRLSNQRETENARATRVDSYVQKFEANYGRVPQDVHADVIGRRITPYTAEQASVQPPISVAAVPVSITLAILAVGWLFTLPPVGAPGVTPANPWKEALTPVANPVTFAFLGSYFFCIQMLFRRYVRSDLRGSAYVAMVIRILMAIIGTWVVVAIAPILPWDLSDSQLLMIGFVIGVFPVVAWQIVRNVMIKTFRFALPSLQSEMSLNYLDGLTVWHESRLEEEDIENVPNMATADIVGLLVCTRLPAERIVDWVDQAILLTYLGPRQVGGSDGSSGREQLSRHGIRTASALLASARSAEWEGRFEDFGNLLTDRSGRGAIPSLITSIQTSTNLELVLRWRGMPAEWASGGQQSSLPPSPNRSS